MEKKVFYTCLIDWDHEMGETKVDLYKTIDELIEDHPVADSCGIVRIEMEAELLPPRTTVTLRGG